MIDWGDALAELKEHESKIEHLSPTASGDYIHSMLEQTFGNIDHLDFEEEISGGRADCIGKDLVYEFKTKDTFNIDRTPFRQDFEQLQRYLNSPEVDMQEGQVVYVNREDLSDVRQYHLSPNYNTNFVADGGLPDISDYDVYEVLVDEN